MNKQPTRRRRTSRAVGRSLALSVALAALVTLLGAGQALATLAPPDERVLERHRRLGELGEAAQPSQGSPAGPPRRFIRPEPPMGPPPQLGDQQVAPSPVRTAPAGGRGGQVVIAVVAAVLVAVGATTTWRVRHRRPQPESTT
jgi:hypothetical protein